MRIVQAEKVGNLVDDRGLDLAPELGRRPVPAEKRAGEDRDAVRQVSGEVVRPAVERHALVDAVERVPLRVEPEVAQQARRGLVLDHHGDVVQVGRELGGDPVEGVGDETLELRALHRSLDHPAAAKPRQASEAIQAVQRGHLVGLRERRVVEDVVDEVVDGPAEGEDRLADMHELRGLLADDVDATEPVRGALEEQLQHAGAVADDLAARDLAKERLSHLVRHAGARQLLFGLAHHRDLGDGEDAVGEPRALAVHRHAEGMRHGEASLVHRRGGEAREADHARADDGERTRDAVEAQDRVAVVDALVVERDRRVASRPRACGDDDEAGAELAPSTLAVEHLDPVRVEKARRAEDGRDGVAIELVLEHLELSRDDGFLAPHEVVDGDVLPECRLDPVQRPLFDAGDVEDRLAERLARDGGRVEAVPAERARTVDHRDALAELLAQIAAEAAPEEALEPALRALLEESGAHAGALCLYDPRQNVLRLAAEIGLSDEGCRRLRTVRRGDPAAWDMPLHGLMNGRASLIESAARNRYVPRLVEASASVRTIACVPLNAGPAPVGSLILVATAPRSFGERDVRALEPVLGDLAAMIESTRRHRRRTEMAEAAAVVPTAGMAAARDQLLADHERLAAEIAARTAEVERLGSALDAAAADRARLAADLTGVRRMAEQVTPLTVALAEAERARARLAEALGAAATERSEQARGVATLEAARTEAQQLSEAARAELASARQVAAEAAAADAASLAEQRRQVERLEARLADAEAAAARRVEAARERERAHERAVEELRATLAHERRVREEREAAARGASDGRAELERAHAAADEAARAHAAANAGG